MNLITPEINEILNKIFMETNPVSIFLYGSRSRTDFIEESDYEIGILYKKENKVSRSELVKRHTELNLRIYPFNYEEFINNDLDTPFPKAVYMKGLISKAKTLYGQNIVETMNPPIITLIDLLEEAVFQMSRAYTAMLSQREGDTENAKAGFVKSVLFGTRTLIVLRHKEFPVGYDEIVNFAKILNIDSEYHDLIEYAFEVRNGKELDASYIYKNISYLNRIIIKEIESVLKLGNRNLI